MSQTPGLELGVWARGLEAVTTSHKAVYPSGVVILGLFVVLSVFAGAAYVFCFYLK